MDQQSLRDLERRCIQEEPAPCRAACPLHVDARAFCGRVAAGDWPGAWQVLRRGMPLPAILGRICDAPCQASCKRDEAGGAIRIGALERACVQTPAPAPPRNMRLPARGGSVAVCGSGLSGLTAARDLALKGYAVELFEPGTVLGAPLLEAFDARRLPPAVVDDETAALTPLLKAVHLGARLSQTETIEELGHHFDALYLDLAAVDTPTRDRHLWADEESSAMTRGILGGGDTPSPVLQAAQGRWAATTIDRRLQKVSITAGREGEGAGTTRLFVSLAQIEPSPPVAMADAAAGYTAAEAVAEAGRCIQCECLECVKVCAYLERFGSYPRQYARQIYNNAAIVMGARQANRLINSCSLCGLCTEICPEDFPMADLCLQSRRDMVARGKMPPSAHEFALLDMQFSLGERFALARHAPGSHHSVHLFFPGCQLCASAPAQVAPVYSHLRRVLDAPVGLMLGCCGAPAHWAGREALCQEVREDWHRQWEAMGRPEVIPACATCLEMFRTHLPEVPVRSLWQVWAESALPELAAPLPETLLAIHDPCTTRHAPAVQDAVRRILNRVHLPFEELELGRRRTECCGFGGLMQNANPQLAEETVRRRATRSPSDYLAYCAVCRDNLAAVGKRTIHLLDLFFPSGEHPDPAGRPRPGWSRRRENRQRLRRDLLVDLWRERSPDLTPHPDIHLHVAPAAAPRLETRRILVEDLQEVIHQAETSGQVLEHPDTGRLRASARIGHVTFWVEYAPAEEGGYTVFNAYSHRMEVAR